MKTHYPCMLVLVAGLLTCGETLHAGPVLAANAGLGGQTLDVNEVKAVLLGKKITLGDVRLVIVIARAGEAQNAFLQSHVGMSASQFLNHWRRLFMTGGGTAPKIVESEAEACKLAAGTPGAIIITDSANATGLAILTKD